MTFSDFHRQNPQVYDELVKLALQIKARGYRKYSIKGLYEVLRFNVAMKTTGVDYKLNNNYTAGYARMIMENEPDLRGFFDLRVRSDDEKHTTVNNVTHLQYR